MEVDGDDDPLAIGVLVDAVNAVLDMDATQIEPPPSFGTGLRQDGARNQNKEPATRARGMGVRVDAVR